MLYICVVPFNTTDKDCQVFSYPFHKKQYFHIILLSYSSLTFDQFFFFHVTTNQSRLILKII